MTKTERKKFIREYGKSLTDYVLKRVDKMPDNWDGIELRWYFAEVADDSSFNKKSPRRKEYNNTVLVNNL